MIIDGKKAKTHTLFVEYAEENWGYEGYEGYSSCKACSESQGSRIDD